MLNPFFSLQMPSRYGNRCSGNFCRKCTPSSPQKKTSQCRQEGMIKNCNEKEFQNHIMYKNAEFGGILIPDKTEKSSIYKVASINVDTSYYKEFIVKLNFNCNLSLEKAGIHIKFQIWKQVLNQLDAVPISPEYYFRKKKESSESTMFSFLSCDREFVGSKCCNYCVSAQVIDTATKGIVVINNPILLTTIIEVK